MNRTVRPLWIATRLRAVATVLLLCSLSVFLLASLFLAGGTAQAAPQAELWPRWKEHDPESSVVVDHTPWRDFLDRYLVTGTATGINLLRYGSVSDADHESLGAYVDTLQEVRVTGLTRPRQFAYWVNLYNAGTVKLVLDHYPVDSIRSIGGLFRRGPWGIDYFMIEGQAVSLNDIEHRILRPIWQDTRIHYAVNCAAMGCPELQPVPFTADNSDELLDRGAAHFVNSGRGVRFEEQALVLSSIYDWFREDFGGSLSGVLAHLAKYAEPRLADRLRAYDGPVSYEYDWSLNDAAAGR